MICGKTSCSFRVLIYALLIIFKICVICKGKATGAYNLYGRIYDNAANKESALILKMVSIVSDGPLLVMYAGKLCEKT